MGEYVAPGVGRGVVVVFFAVSAVWTVFVVISALGGGTGSQAYALFSAVTFVWNTYWGLYRIAFRVSLRRGELDWHAPMRTETVRIADIESIRFLALLPNVLSIRRRGGHSLLIMSGKGLSALVAGVVKQRPDFDHDVGPWTRFADRVPGPSWWRPGRHYRSVLRSESEPDAGPALDRQAEPRPQPSPAPAMQRDPEPDSWPDPEPDSWPHPERAQASWPDPEPAAGLSPERDPEPDSWPDPEPAQALWLEPEPAPSRPERTS